MSLSPLPLLSALVVTAACLFPVAAHAGEARTTFVVSTHVVEAGTVGVGADGVVTTSGKKALTRVTTTQEKKSSGETWTVVTLSY
jgi:hypothetical protein